MRMKLLPNYFKKIGLFLFFVGFVMSFLSTGVDGFVEGYVDSRNEYLTRNSAKKGIEFHPKESGDFHYGLSLSDGWNRFFDLCVYGGMLLYMLSREKNEDEFFRVIRLETGWMTMVFALALIFLIYLLAGEIKVGLSYLLALPLIFFLILYHFRKKWIVMEDSDE